MTVGLDPSGIVSHPPEFHDGMAWKQPCRVATTANITIATGLNAGDTIDGVTLAAGDRVLVKDQTAGAENGLYLAGVTPTRAFDMDQDLAYTDKPVDEVLGAIVYVIAGTANGGKLYRCTNTSTPVLGTTALVFTEFTSGGAAALDDLTDVTITTAATADRLRYNGTAWVNSTLHWQVLFDSTGSALLDGLGNPIETEVA